MSSKNRLYETEIDSDLGSLKVVVEYEIDGGQKGDYHTPHIEPSVNIVDIKLHVATTDPRTIEFLEDEILENELS